MRARGFTLLEVLIAVAVIAIVAAVALPQYGRAVQRSYWRTARDLLQTIYSGEQVYQTANGTYVDADNPAVCTGIPPTLPVWRCIYMDDPQTNTIPVTYDIGGVGANTFTATATYEDGAARPTLTVDQNRNWGGTWAMP